MISDVNKKENEIQKLIAPVISHITDIQCLLEKIESFNKEQGLIYKFVVNKSLKNLQVHKESVLRDVQNKDISYNFVKTLNERTETLTKLDKEIDELINTEPFFSFSQKTTMCDPIVDYIDESFLMMKKIVSRKSSIEDEIVEKMEKLNKGIDTKASLEKYIYLLLNGYIENFEKSGLPKIVEKSLKVGEKQVLMMTSQHNKIYENITKTMEQIAPLIMAKKKFDKTRNLMEQFQKLTWSGYSRIKNMKDSYDIKFCDNLQTAIKDISTKHIKNNIFKNMNLEDKINIPTQSNIKIYVDLVKKKLIYEDMHQGILKLIIALRSPNKSLPKIPSKTIEFELKKMVVVLNFNSSKSTHLDVQENQIVSVLDENTAGWILVRNDKGKQGQVPSNYLRIVTPSELENLKNAEKRLTQTSKKSIENSTDEESSKNRKMVHTISINVPNEIIPAEIKTVEFHAINDKKERTSSLEVSALRLEKKNEASSDFKQILAKFRDPPKDTTIIPPYVEKKRKSQFSPQYKGTKEEPPSVDETKDGSPKLTKVEPPTLTNGEPPKLTKVEPPTLTNGEPPKLTKVDSPTLTNGEPPKLTKVEPPTLTKEEPPKLTKVEPPTLTKVEPPTLTKVEPPTLTKEEPPKLTKVEPPTLTKEEPPKLKKVEPPKLKKVEPPKLTKEEPPKLKKVEPPKLKKVEPPKLTKEEPPKLKKVEPPKLTKEEPPKLKKVEPPKLTKEEPPKLKKVETSNSNKTNESLKKTVFKSPPKPKTTSYKKGNHKSIESNPPENEVPEQPEGLFVGRIYKILRKYFRTEIVTAEEGLLVGDFCTLTQLSYETGYCHLKNLRLNKEYIVPIGYIDNRLDEGEQTIIVEKKEVSEPLEAPEGEPKKDDPDDGFYE